MSTVSILVIVDGTLKFDDPTSDFSLDLSLEQVCQSKGFRFDVVPYYADYVTVDVVSHSIWDQIWLFGASKSRPESWAAIATAINNRMSNGVGVFATGDHEDLGAGMGRTLRRVRSMRHWGVPDPLVDSAGIDIPNVDLYSRTRINTIGFAQISGDFDATDVDDQPKYPEMRLFGETPEIDYHFICKMPSGLPIRVLPDHGHEGICIDWPELNRIPEDARQGVEEEFGSRTPTVIADAHSHTFRDRYYPVDRMLVYGAISVHDPDANTDLGRVVVDSTFHHWTFDQIKAFSSPASTRGVWKQVQQYFQNVAIWLTPMKTRLQALLDGASRELGSANAQNLFGDLPEAELVPEKIGHYLWGQLAAQFGLSTLIDLLNDLIRYGDRNSEDEKSQKISKQYEKLAGLLRGKPLTFRAAVVELVYVQVLGQIGFDYFSKGASLKLPEKYVAKSVSKEAKQYWKFPHVAIVRAINKELGLFQDESKAQD